MAGLLINFSEEGFAEYGLWYLVLVLAAHRDQKGLMVRVNRASTMAFLYYEEDGHYMHKVIMINVIIYFSFYFLILDI